MTISEQLRLGVLSAPVASLDRRALSQAWYSALYGNDAPRVLPDPCAQNTRMRTTISARTLAGVQDPNVHRLPSRAAKGRAHVEARSASEAPGERRVRSPLARRIEKLFLRPGEPVRRAAFLIDGSGARVHIVLHTHGKQTTLLALCPQRSLERVANALAQARYALASRGITVQALVRADAP